MTKKDAAAAEFQAMWREYEDRVERSYELIRAKIKDASLASRLEQFCDAHDGFMTYEEYLQLEQFGRDGYHEKHDNHGATSGREKWAEQLIHLCKNQKFEQVVEFGFGDGALGLKTLELAQKEGMKKIRWCGVEANADLIEKAKRKFTELGFMVKRFFRPTQVELVESISRVPHRKKTLVVFQYSLDSVPPQLFTSTSKGSSSIDTMLGLTVKDGILQEIHVSDAQLKARGISFQNGVYTDAGGNTFDLSSWETIMLGQRAYVAIGAFSALANMAKRVGEGSSFLVIDEFQRIRKLPHLENGHLCLPKSLTDGGTDIEQELAYEEAGNKLFYYPTYLPTMISVLEGLGFNCGRRGVIEEKFAEELVGRTWTETRTGPGTHLSLAVLAENMKRKPRKNGVSVTMPRGITNYS